MSILAKSKKQAAIFGWVFKILLPFAFIFEGIYAAEMLYNSLPYISGFGQLKIPFLSHWMIIIGSGVFSFILYCVISNFAYTVAARMFVGVTMQSQMLPFSKAQFSLNLDFCYLIALLMLGSFNFLYYTFSYAYTFSWLIKLVILSLSLSLFYFLMQRGVEKKYKKAMLGAFLIPYALLLAFV